MQQRDVDRGLHVVGEAMHRVRAQHQGLSTGYFQAAGEFGEPPSGLLPVAATLELLDRREVDAPHYAFGRVQAAEPLAHGLVEQAVILDRGLPTHPAQESDGPHARD